MDATELLPDEGIIKKIITKGFWLYFFSFIIAPLWYLVRILISTDLPVEEVGVLYGVVGLITLLSTYNDLGMTESLKHFIPKFIIENKSDHIKSILVYALLVQIFTGLLIAGLLYFGADFLATYYFKTEIASYILKIFSIYFLGFNIFQVISTFLLSIQKTFETKLIDFLRFLVVALLTSILFFTDLGSLEYYTITRVVGIYIGILSALIIFFTKFYKKIFSGVSMLWNFSLFKTVAKYATMVFLGTSVGTILGQIDLQMIIYMLGAEAGGYYTNYLSLLGISWILIGPIFSLLFPVFSEFYSKQDTQGISDLRTLLVNSFIILGIVLSIFIFIFSEPLAYIFFGQKFLLSGNILEYSILLISFNLLLQINLNILAGIGKVKERVKIIYITVVFNLGMNYFLIQQFGIYGAAMATAMGWILMWGLSERVLLKEYVYSLYRNQIIKNIFCFVCLGGISYNFILPMLSSTNRYHLLGQLTTIGLLYFILFIILNKTHLIQVYKKSLL